MTCVVTHNSGFFSCCSIKLYKIIQYFNTHKSLPDAVDSSAQFSLYKTNYRVDLTFEYFNHYSDICSFVFDHIIDYDHDDQFRPFTCLNYGDITPFITKYFSPSREVSSMLSTMESKYALDYDNLCTLFYRGNDKITETPLSSYDDYVQHGRALMLKHPGVRFLIQSDETEFIETMMREFPGSFLLKDEIRHMKRCRNTVDRTMRYDILRFSKLYLAITILMSKSKYIVCGSGNCSIWIMLYRGHTDGVFQHLKDKWLAVP